MCRAEIRRHRARELAQPLGHAAPPQLAERPFSITQPIWSRPSGAGSVIAKCPCDRWKRACWARSGGQRQPTPDDVEALAGTRAVEPGVFARRRGAPVGADHPVGSDLARTARRVAAHARDGAVAMQEIAHGEAALEREAGPAAPPRARASRAARAARPRADRRSPSGSSNSRRAPLVERAARDRCSAAARRAPRRGPSARSRRVRSASAPRRGTRARNRSGARAASPGRPRARADSRALRLRAPHRRSRSARAASGRELVCSGDPARRIGTVSQYTMTIDGKAVLGADDGST